MDNVNKIIEIAKRYSYTVDDLLSEAELVEDYGEFQFIPLLGYTPEDLRKAAEILNK